MSMLFHFTKLRLSNAKCNGSRVKSIKNVKFKFQLPSMFVFLVFAKVVLLKVVHPLKTYQHTENCSVKSCIRYKLLQEQI
jgi:hypothetical protein